jgi:glutamate-1-semialdehyde 2,1-aminomutase
MSSSPAFTALKAATKTAQAEYTNANPKSEEAFINAKASGVAGGTNRASIFYTPFPLTFVNATEATAITADGQHLTDFLGNYTAGLFGFSPTPVIEAVSKAMENGHALGGAPNLLEAKVAKAFTSRFPSIDLVRFSNTGTEANSYAIHTARAVTGRKKIMMYDGAYHGAWIHGGKMAGPLDTPYEKIIVPYGDANLIAQAIRENASDLAAFIMEPVMVNPMVYLKQVAPTQYLQTIRDACTESGCALIFDEVMTSRLSPGGAQELIGVTPDLTTFGKYYGGGLPFGGFGGTTQWMERHDPLHPETINSGGTFNQNALCMTAVDAVFEHLWTPEQCIAHNSKGDWFREEINRLAKSLGAPCQACGTGSLITLIWQRRPVVQAQEGESVSHRLDLAPQRSVFEASQLFWFHMLQKHSILAGSPKLNYLTLPTALSDQDYKRFLAAMGEFFNTYREELRLLAAETAEGIEPTQEEKDISAMMTTPYTPQLHAVNETG